MKKSELLKALSVNALITYNKSFETGFETGYRNGLFKILTDVKVGDLVMEMSTKSFKPASLRIGRLLRIEKDKGVLGTYTIRNAYGKKITWSNCSFIKILEEK